MINKDVPPYCFMGGVPAKLIKFKLTIDKILEHDVILYPVAEGFSIDKLGDGTKRQRRRGTKLLLIMT